MSDVGDFWDSLGSSEQDLLLQVMDVLDSDHETYIKAIDEQLKKIKEALNIVNKQREFLSDDLAALRALASTLEGYIAKNGGDLTLNLLQYLLLTQIDELSVSVQETRPTEILDHKHHLKQQRRKLEITELLMARIEETRTGKGAVNGD